MTDLVIISGPPAAGKTTLGRRLAADLRLPFFYKDGIKETLFDALGWEDRAWSRRLGIASYGVLYHVIAAELAAGRSLLAESNFHPRQATAEFRALQERWPFRPIQVMCHADGQVLTRRFLARDGTAERHPGHVDQSAYEDAAAVLARGRLDPLGLDGPVIWVDTTDPAAVDYEGLLNRVRALSELP